MPGPARAGALIYARHLEALSSFYRNLLEMQPLAQDADLRRGQKAVRRGRPRLANPRQMLFLRLSPEVIASWKATGPGWQTRMAKVLESSTPRTRKHAG